METMPKLYYVKINSAKKVTAWTLNPLTVVFPVPCLINCANSLCLTVWGLKDNLIKIKWILLKTTKGLFTRNEI